MQEYATQWGQLVARAWSDDAFKARLLAEPAPTLAEQGITMPPGVEIRVHENTPTMVHLTIPPKPSDDLSDEQLDSIAGGAEVSTASTVGTFGSVCGCVSSLGSMGTQASIPV